MSNHTILFKVAAVSSNTNSFGLRGHVLISRTGLAVQLGLNYLNERKTGAEIKVSIEPAYDGNGQQIPWTPDRIASQIARQLSGEIPRVLSKAPAAVVREVFSKN